MERYWYATCDHQDPDRVVLRVIGEYEVRSDACTWTLEPTDQATAEDGQYVLEFRVTCPPDAPDNPTVLQVDYTEYDPIEYDSILIVGDHDDVFSVDHLGTMGDPSEVS